MEHIVTSHITAKTTIIFYPLQHCFRKGRSCEEPAAIIRRDIISNASESQYCIIVNKRTCINVTRQTHCGVRLLTVRPRRNGNQQMIQRRLARFLKHRYHCRSIVTEILQNLQRTSFQDIKTTRFTLFCKIVNNQVAVNKSDRLLPNLRTAPPATDNRPSPEPSRH